MKSFLGQPHVSITTIVLPPRLLEYAIALFACLFLTAQIQCSAAELTLAGEDSWRLDGLFCFRSGSGTTTQINMARHEHGEIKLLFAKSVGKAVQSPICLSNGVIVVSSDGLINKIDSTGATVFAATPAGFVGASGFSGRLSDNDIYITETVYDKQSKKWLYHLYVVNISGTNPTVKAKFNITQPLKITRISGEIIVIGQKDVLRLSAP